MTHIMDDAALSRKLQPVSAVTGQGPVEYADVGQGPVVVALHGVMGGWDQSLILAQTIGDHGHRYLAVSRPGYLGTPLASGQSPEQQGDLIASLLDALSVPRAAVMAVSGGGPAALQFGLRHADRCAGLVLVSTRCETVGTELPFSFRVMLSLTRWSWLANRFRKKAAQDWAAVAARSIRDEAILHRTLGDEEAWPLLQSLLMSTMDRMGRRAQGTRNDIKISQTSYYPLEELSEPVLVVHGSDDPIVPFAANTESYLARTPRAELFAVEGGEHVAIFTHRHLVRPKVAEFMRRIVW